FTGPKQQIDTKLQELKNKQQLLIPTSPNGWDQLPSNSAPKLIFNRVNGKRTQIPSSDVEREVYTLAHEENVRFIYQAWEDVKHKMEEPGQNGCAPQQYQDQSPDNPLKSK
ncbi:hypothetical protein GDO86_004528, partial [Hymenochirus boettgeri]